MTVSPTQARPLSYVAMTLASSTSDDVQSRAQGSTSQEEQKLLRTRRVSRGVPKHRAERILVLRDLRRNRQEPHGGFWSCVTLLPPGVCTFWIWQVFSTDLVAFEIMRCCRVAV